MMLPDDSVVATLGPNFSFHDIALSPNKGNAKVVFCSNFDDIFQALKDNTVSHAFIALRNSIHGVVANNLVFIEENDLEVIKQIDLPIQLHLAAKAPCDPSGISKVIAHPVAWQECQEVIKKNGFKQIISNSNAQALIDLKQSEKVGTAAISGREAIAHYGLEIIQENIHDCEPNITSFGLVTKKKDSR